MDAAGVDAQGKTRVLGGNPQTGPFYVEGAMPGDMLVVHVKRLRLSGTRAVSDDAPAREIWPWLVQFGPGRGGAYTYDWIENLFGLGMHSADRILPELQDLKVGDRLELIPGYSDFTNVLHDEFYGIRSGRLEVVWPLAGRGKIR